MTSGTSLIEEPGNAASRPDFNVHRVSHFVDLDLISLICKLKGPK